MELSLVSCASLCTECTVVGGKVLSDLGIWKLSILSSASPRAMA
jgi:hypothetical protein